MVGRRGTARHNAQATRFSVPVDDGSIVHHLDQLNWTFPSIFFFINNRRTKLGFKPFGLRNWAVAEIGSISTSLLYVSSNKNEILSVIRRSKLLHRAIQRNEIHCLFCF